VDLGKKHMLNLIWEDIFAGPYQIHGQDLKGEWWVL
jgi:hypothetical protein